MEDKFYRQKSTLSPLELFSTLTAMNLELTCSKCGHRFFVDDALAGREVLCPNCQNPVSVPRRKIRFRQTPLYQSEQSPPPPDESHACPHCQAKLAMAAVICVACGWDLRTNKPLVTRTGNTRRWKRPLVGTLAVLLIALSLGKLWRDFTPPVPTRYQAIKPTPSWVTALKAFFTGLPAEGDAQVTNWRVNALTELSQTNRPFEGVSGSDPTSGNAGAALRPAISVRVTIELTTTNATTPVWPLATTVQLWRADRSDGDYRRIRKLTDPTLAQLRSPPPRGLTPQRQTQFYIRDLDVEPGHRYFYQVEFLGRKNRTLARSGFCSAVALAVPPARVKHDATGRATILWDEVTWATALVARPPALSVENRNIHALAWRPLRAGEYQSPAGTNSVFGRSLTLDFCLTTAVEQDSWSSAAAQSRLIMPIQLRVPLDPPMNRPMFAAAQKAVAVQWTSPMDGTGLLNLSAFLDPTMGDPGNEGRPLPPGDANLTTRIFIWHASRKQGSQHIPDPHGPLVTAVVSAVSSPLPTGLRASAGAAEVQLAWNAISVDPQDWVDSPQFVLLRAEESDVVTSGGQITVTPQPEIYRGPIATTAFVDRSVQAGKAYFYQLGITGVSRAQSWSQEAGSFACFLPVWVRADLAAGERPVVAVPGPVGPLRVALRGKDIEAQLVEAVGRRWSNLPWLRVTNIAESTAAVTAQIPRLAAADVQLVFSRRQLHDQLNLDVWLEDIAQAQQHRILTQPLAQVQTSTLATDLAQKLSQLYPNRTAGADHALQVAMQRLQGLANQSTPPPPPPGPSYQRGREAELAGHLNDAAQIYATCLDHSDAYAALTRVLDNLSPTEQLVPLRALMTPHRPIPTRVQWKAAEQLVGAHPGDLELLTATSRLAREAGAADRADELLKKSIAATPTAAGKMQRLKELAETARDRGDAAAFHKYLEEASQLTDSTPEAQQLRQAFNLLELRGDKKRQGPAVKSEPGSDANAFLEMPGGVAKLTDRGPSIQVATDDSDAAAITLRFSSRGVVTCLDKATKQPRWEYDVHTPAPYTARGHDLMIWRGGEGVQWLPDLQVFATSYSVSQGVVYLADVRGGVLHAVDLASGKCRWRYIDWAKISGPLVRPEGIWLGNAFGDLTLIDRETGKPLRKASHPPELEIGWFDQAPLLLPVDATAVAFVEFEPTRSRPRLGIFPVSHKIAFQDCGVTVLIGPPPPPIPTPTAVAPEASWGKALPEFSNETYAGLVRQFYEVEGPTPAVIHPIHQQIIAEVVETFRAMRRGDPQARERFINMLGYKDSALHLGLAALLVARWQPDPEFGSTLWKQVNGKGSGGILYAVSEALTAIGDVRAIPALIQALPEAPPTVAADFFHRHLPEVRWSQFTVTALEQLSGEKLGPYRLCWESWWNTQGAAALLGDRQ